MVGFGALLIPGDSLRGEERAVHERQIPDGETLVRCGIENGNRAPPDTRSVHRLAEAEEKMRAVERSGAREKGTRRIFLRHPELYSRNLHPRAVEPNVRVRHPELVCLTVIEEIPVFVADCDQTILPEGKVRQNKRPVLPRLGFVIRLRVRGVKSIAPQACQGIGEDHDPAGRRVEHPPGNARGVEVLSGRKGKGERACHLVFPRIDRIGADGENIRGVRPE